MKKYHLQPQEIKINLLRVKNLTYYVHDREWLGWKPLALKGIAVHDIPGEHSYIFSPPHDKESARILQGILDSAS